MPRYKPQKKLDNNVGYGRPPKETQFKPGQSGNPKGRPKGRKSIQTTFREALEQKVAVTMNGKTRLLSKLELIFHRLTTDAARGETHALKMVLALIERHLPELVEGSHTVTELPTITPGMSVREAAEAYAKELTLTPADYARLLPRS